MSVLQKLRVLLRPQLFFVLCASIVGLLLLLLVPPMQTYDEQDHFLRAYQLSQGDLLPDVVQGIPGMHPDKAPGGNLPLNLLGFSYNSLYSVRLADKTDQKDETLKANHDQFQGQNVNPAVTQAAFFPTAGAYSPIAYAPQIVAVRLGTMLHLSMVHFYYLGRLFMLLVWIGLIYAAIRLLPIGRWALVAIALLPASLFQATTFSADAMTNALVFLTIAVFVRWAYTKIVFSWRQIALVAALCLALSLCKSGFWIVALLFWLVPVARFASRKQYLWANGLISGLSIVAFGIWYKLVAYLVPYMGAVNNPGEAINNVTQTAYVFHEPIRFGWTILRTYFQPEMFHKIIMGIGSYAWGEASVGVGGYVIMLALVAVGLVAAAVEKKAPLDYGKWQRLAALAAIVLLIGFVSVSLYTVFTPVHADVINGVQGRYFIPYLALLLPIVAGVAYKYRHKFYLHQLVEHMYFIAPPLIVVLVCMVVSIVRRYYVE